MKQNKNKKKWTAAAAALAIIAALAGTFAWFTSNDSTKNHFETSKAGNDTEIVETFDPPKDWKPGQTVNKDVAIKNNGNFNSLIRVSLIEMLDRYASANTATLDAAGLASNTISSYELFTFEGDVTDWDATTLSANHTIKVTQKDKSEETLNLYVFEKENAGANTETGNAYQYQAYWATAANADVKYFAKTGSLKRDAATGEVTLEEQPKIKIYDAERETATVDWRTGPYAASFETSTVAGAAADDKFVVSAHTAYGDKIELYFNNIVDASAADTAAAQGKWAYNKDDGYFYYIGVVPPQEQTTQLLDAVKLHSDAGNEYAGMKYDLTVYSEGIQALQAAAESAQWLNINGPSVPSASAAKILQGLIDAGLDPANV